MEKPERPNFPNWFTTFSFSMPADTKAVEFFNRLEEQHMEFHEKIQARIDSIYKQNIEVSDKADEQVKNLLYNIFAYGYSNGWNDYKSIIDNNKKTEP